MSECKLDNKFNFQFGNYFYYNLFIAVNQTEIHIGFGSSLTSQLFLKNS